MRDPRCASLRDARRWCLLAALVLAPACGGEDPETTPTTTPTPTAPASTPFVDDWWQEDLEPALDGSLFMSMDAFDSGRVTFVDAQDGTMVWSRELEPAAEDFCGYGGCMFHEVKHTIQDGHDYLTVIGTRGADMSSTVVRVPLDDTDAPVFNLRGFDFSRVPQAGCLTPPADTCAPSYNSREDDLCSAKFVHTFAITSDERGSVSMILGDHFGARLVAVTLDYGHGSQCAQVDWVLDDSDPGWVPECEPNSIERFFDDGKEMLLVTCRNTIHTLGAGRVVLYEVEAATTTGLSKESGAGSRPNFKRLWVFPEAQNLETLEGTLNSPHDARLIKGADGRTWTLTYAHTGGLAVAYDHDLISTVGVAVLDGLAAQPQYVGDLYLAGSASTTSLRIVTSVEWRSPGWFLVGDTPQLTEVDGVGRGVLLSIPLLTPSAKHGAWSPDHADQTLIPVDANVLTQYDCVGSSPYQFTWEEASSLGPDLTRAMGQPDSVCPAGDASTARR